MAQEGKNPIVGAAVVAMLFAVTLMAAPPALSASTPPCPFSAKSMGALSVASSGPGPLNPCPGAEWSRTYGGPGGDEFNAIVQTPDGGYIAAGKTSSFGGGDYEN